MPSMPRWIRTSSAGIQLMSVVACIFDGWSWSKPAARTIAAMRTAPVTVTPCRSTAWSGDFPAARAGRAAGRRRRRGAGATTIEREKELHHGFADIDHGAHAPDGDEDGGDHQDDGAGEQRAEVGLHVAGLGAADGRAERRGERRPRRVRRCRRPRGPGSGRARRRPGPGGRTARVYTASRWKPTAAWRCSGPSSSRPGSAGSGA